MKCIAFDNETIALSQIEANIVKTPLLCLSATFDNTIADLSYLQHHEIDLMFVGINMPDLSKVIKTLS